MPQQTQKPWVLVNLIGGTDLTIPCEACRRVSRVAVIGERTLCPQCYVELGYAGLPKVDLLEGKDWARVPEVSHAF